MDIVPLQPTGISNLLQADVASQSINSTQSQLLTLENDISTGKQINQISDDPSAAATILSLQNTLNQRQIYANNITQAQSQLNSVNSALSSVSSLVLQAQGIASQAVNTGVTQDQRTGDAQIINSIISQAIDLANTSSNGVYVFGGDKGNQNPYVSTAGGVQYVGGQKLLENNVDSSTLIPAEVSGSSVFGGLSEEVQGASLQAAATTDTGITNVANGSTSIDLGTIQLSDGQGNSAMIDLSGAKTLGDVVSDINNAAVGDITASVNGTGHLVLSGASGSDNISVSDVGTGTSAADLGITSAGGGKTVTGAPLTTTQIDDLTPLSSLFGGTGLDTHGFIVGNGTASATIVPTAGGDIQSLLNQINGAGLGVTAEINSGGTGINILNATQGTQMTIGENGGTTAMELGIRSFSPSTDLSQLNNGQGITPATSGGDFTITAANGSSYNISIAGATTVEDVINDINSDAGPNVEASFATTGNGIILTDFTTGSGTLTVTPNNGSSVASELGLTTPASGNKITGSDANPIQVSGLFTDLQALSSALESGDTNAITAAGSNLQTDYNQITDAQGVAGAQAQNLGNRSSQIQSENTATQTLLSNIQDTNMTTAVTQFQQLQTSLQGTLETTALSQELSLLNFLQ
jgi:flagellar hook-associated protein 3 FlgL